jgi:hypothetical protein
MFGTTLNFTDINFKKGKYFNLNDFGPQPAKILYRPGALEGHPEQ